MDVRIMRAAEANSHHHLGRRKVKLKTRKEDQNNERWNIDLEKLKKPETENKFNIELKNRFTILDGNSEDGRSIRVGTAMYKSKKI